MSEFQLDQNINSKKLVKTCRSEGSVVRRFPRRLHDRKDPEILHELMARPEPFVTMDRNIADQHCSVIPDDNPGIIIIANAAIQGTITVLRGMKILSEFKKRHPEWREIGWNNSIVEITEQGTTVWHVARGVLICDGYTSFIDEDCVDQLRLLLARNADRPAKS